MLLRCVPKGICSWDFRVEGEAGRIGSTGLRSRKEQGSVELGGTTHEIVKHGMMSGRWSLTDGDGRERIAARKPSVFSHRVLLMHAETTYTLQKRGWMSRSFELLGEGEEPLLRIEPDHAFTRRATLRAEELVPMEMLLFAFWLVTLMWQREARDATAVGASPDGG